MSHSVRTSVVSVLVTVFMVTAVAAASAETPTWICVPEAAGKGVKSGGAEGTCGSAQTAVELPPPGEMTTLNDILPHIQYIGSGVGGKPTIRFSGVNVQIVNGEGSTASTNGDGNLVIGYDEEPRTQTGSHNLVLGKEQSYTSYGGIAGGRDSSVTGPFASVTGGVDNTASGEVASVSGGGSNKASNEAASVSGGVGNQATAGWASVSGGEFNKATAHGASILGGNNNTSSGGNASVVGGLSNLAEGTLSVVYGGNELKATNLLEVIG